MLPPGILRPRILLPILRPRNNNGACIIRVAEALRAAGLHVLHERGPWLMEGMAERHLRGVAGVGGQSQRHMAVHRTANEDGDVEIVTASWQPFTQIEGPKQVI